MLAKPKETKGGITIIPYIGEPGSGYDNWSYSKKEQQEILQKRTPDILQYIGNDYREKQTLDGKSNQGLFIDWLLETLRSKNNPFVKSDGGYKFVLFTHSIFLKTWFGLNSIQNNNAVHIKFDTDIHTAYNNKSRNVQLTSTIAIKDNDIKLINFIDKKIRNKCPDGCIKTLCSKSNIARNLSSTVNSTLNNTRKRNSILQVNLTNKNQPFYVTIGNTKKRGRTPRNLVG